MNDVKLYKTARKAALRRLKDECCYCYRCCSCELDDRPLYFDKTYRSTVFILGGIMWWISKDDTRYYRWNPLVTPTCFNQLRNFKLRDRSWTPDLEYRRNIAVQKEIKDE